MYEEKNAITENIKTNEISQALGRGKHTTRHVELLSLGDGYLADTPGFGTVDFTGIDAYTLSQQFREFFEALPNCKYGQCLHINEPNCEVKRKIENNEFDDFLDFDEFDINEF